MTKPKGISDETRKALKARVDGIGRKRVAMESPWTYAALSAILDKVFQSCTVDKTRMITEICDKIENKNI